VESGSTPLRKAMAAVFFLVSLPVCVLAFSTIVGLGLDQNLPSQIAILGAACVIALPVLGLASMLGGSGVAQAASLGIWSLAILTALPGYFPERREDAARIGIHFFTSAFEAPSQTKAVDAGLAILTLLGPEPPPTLRAERVVEDAPSPKLDVAPHNRANDSNARPERNQETTWIPYHGEGQSIVISAHTDGPNFGDELNFVFDTGATLTTLSQNALRALDIRVPADAPIVTLRTAAGEIEAKLVLVDAIWLDEELVEWVTVAVCEYCANDTTDGLLGLNVSSHYRVSIDHESEEIEFAPRPGRRNRRLDIQPWLELDSVLRRWDDGRLELTVDAKNRARQGIKSSVLEITCGDESFTLRLDPIPAFGSMSQPASLPWGSECDQFQIETVAAAWDLDRI